MQVRQRYTKEFKLEAVRQLEEGIKPAAVVARELGVRRNQLYKWKNELTDKGDVAGGVMKDTGKKNGNGLPITQLMWLSRIVNELQGVIRGFLLNKQASKAF